MAVCIIDINPVSKSKSLEFRQQSYLLNVCNKRGADVDHEIGHHLMVTYLRLCIAAESARGASVPKFNMSNIRDPANATHILNNRHENID